VLEEGELEIVEHAIPRRGRISAVIVAKGRAASVEELWKFRPAAFPS
jgi:hypothetical protein